MSKKYIMSIYAGTTKNRVMIVDEKSNIIAIKYGDVRLIYRHPGWVEFDPLEDYNCIVELMKEVLKMARLTAKDIAAIGVTNQRESTVIWDKNTESPVYYAIGWQSRQTDEIADRLKEAGLSDKFREKTGLAIDAYFSATKIVWILNNIPGVREMAEDGDVLFGTMDSWLIWKLTGGRSHVTDYTNASRTMLFNINDLCWDEELLEILDIPRSMLPEVKPSSCVYGFTYPTIIGFSVPVASAAGDQSADLFGQQCFNPGDTKNTYSNGGFLLMNTGDKKVISQHGLVTTIACCIDGKVEYALEGSVFVSRSALQWLRDGLKLIDEEKDVDWFSSKVDDSGGVYFVPAFRGLGAPYWDSSARGMIIGITQGTSKAHIARATMESLAYQTKDVLDAMQADTGMRVTSLKVDGLPIESDILMQFQADMLEVPVHRPKTKETHLLGAAYLAGLAIGVWKSREDIKSAWILEKSFEPTMPHEEVDKRYKGWRRAVRHCTGWLDD